ncbi:MAG: YggS family pyridoxal phosphate-dependent enzyme [Desulfobacteraceae bacterium]|nr:MAG: YggS family pyridoxal phosphate-dependent enzyme [Desulfobacteraceae bacterium]
MILKERIDEINSRIRDAAYSCGRNPEEIKLVAVTKTVSAEKIREASVCGVSVIGESYIQEARKKYSLLSGTPVSWHFIGHLQTNKAGYAVKMFDLIHSVDSIRLAEELDICAKKINKVQNILIQINAGREETKSGINEEALPDFIMEASRFQNISIKGLMAIPPFFDDPERVRPYFSSLRALRDKIRNLFVSDAVPGVSINELSMGMSGDFEAAVEEGSTLVRIGTAVFGERK